MKKDYIEKTLSNGIKVYLYKDSNCKRIFASLNCKYGHLGYFDRFYLNDKAVHLPPAMAHFIEHYLIEQAQEGNILHYFRDKNFDFNGITYSEITTYFFQGVGEIYEPLKTLINMVDNPIFTEKSVDEIKNAIYEELKRVSDNKYSVLFANNRHNLNNNYEAVAHGNCNLGSIETTKSITKEDVEKAYEAYYNDENKFLVIGGNIDVDRTIEELEKIYKTIKRHPNTMKSYDYKDDFSVRKEKDIIEMHGDADLVMVTYKLKNDFDIEPILLDSYIHLYTALKFGSSTPFVENLSKKRIVVGGIGQNADFFQNQIGLSFYTESYDYEKFLESLDNELNLEGLEEEEFELIKKGMIFSELQKKDFIYSCFKDFPLHIDFTKSIDIIDKIKSLKFSEMKEIIKKMDFSVKTVSVVTNKKTT